MDASPNTTLSGITQVAATSTSPLHDGRTPSESNERQNRKRVARKRGKRQERANISDKAHCNHGHKTQHRRTCDVNSRAGGALVALLRSGRALHNTQAHLVNNNVEPVTNKRRGSVNMLHSAHRATGLQCNNEAPAATVTTASQKDVSPQ